MIPYSFHPEAEPEFADAVLFYESYVEGLGRRFSDEVDRIVSLIRQHPEAGMVLQPGVRRVLVDRFPYGVAYRYDHESIVILAIAHLRQRPGYWRRRK